MKNICFDNLNFPIVIHVFWVNVIHTYELWILSPPPFFSYTSLYQLIIMRFFMIKNNWINEIVQRICLISQLRFLKIYFRSYMSNIFQSDEHFLLVQLKCTETFCRKSTKFTKYLLLYYFRLDMYGEKYKPFKGVKYITKAGRFQVRM